jgi:hypothetical protein
MHMPYHLLSISQRSFKISAQELLVATAAAVVATRLQHLAER